MERLEKLTNDHIFKMMQMLEGLFPDYIWSHMSVFDSFRYSKDVEDPGKVIPWMEACITIIPKAMGDQHYLCNWIVTRLTSKREGVNYAHPVDYLYGEYKKEPRDNVKFKFIEKQIKSKPACST